jgi:ethanolamine utilization protein EutP (predicted NTPase)
LDLFYEVKNNFTKEGKIQIVILFNKMDLANSDEIEYLKEKLNIGDEEFFLINALTGENLDDVVKYLKEKYDNSQ